jgi:hypothetical protein
MRAAALVHAVEAHVERPFDYQREGRRNIK